MLKLFKLIDELETEVTKLRQWKLAVLDACTVRGIKGYEDSPRWTLNKLLETEAAFALDPLISEEAQRLIEQGRQGVLKQNQVNPDEAPEEYYAKEASDCHGCAYLGRKYSAVVCLLPEDSPIRCTSTERQDEHSVIFIKKGTSQ